MSIESYEYMIGLDTFAGDLSAFSEHAHRDEVLAKDVILCSTKNDDLVCMMIGYDL